MSDAPPPAAAKAPTRPETPPTWKWLMRVTGTLALLLFLTPTFYVMKYYSVDLPREQKLQGPHVLEALQAGNPDALFYYTALARQAPDPANRRVAVQAMGNLLQQPGLNWKRPLESLSAKATLADLATKDPDATLRAAASQELGRVAQGGAVIRR